MISYVILTHNRPVCLNRTLENLGVLQSHEGEVIVIDNASHAPISVPEVLTNNLPVRYFRNSVNEYAAGRNEGAEQAVYPWLVMLDDDSYPLNVGHLDIIDYIPDDVAAVGADVVLADGKRGYGGLPEVFIGCGVMLRRDVFLSLGGYQNHLEYYAEEYDLCARIIAAGWKIVYDDRFQVQHYMDQSQRDVNRTLSNLTRNNALIMNRYAPDSKRKWCIARELQRYGEISLNEAAANGYNNGVRDFLESLDQYSRTPLSEEHFDRLTGLAQARISLSQEDALKYTEEVSLCEKGKNTWAVEQVLHELGVQLVPDKEHTDVQVIATLSPGKIVDAMADNTHSSQVIIPPVRNVMKPEYCFSA